MQHYQARQSTQTFNVLVIFIFAVVVLQGIAVATPAKNLSGIRQGDCRRSESADRRRSRYGKCGGKCVQTKYTHNYKVQTETRVYELDCGKLPMFWGSTGHG